MPHIIEITGGGPADGATVQVGCPFPPTEVATPVIGVPVSSKTGKPVDRDPKKGDTIAVCIYNPLTCKFYYLNSIRMTTMDALQEYLYEKQCSIRKGQI